MKLLIPALIAGVLIGGSAQAEPSIDALVDSHRRMHERVNGGGSDEAQLRREQLELIKDQRRLISSQQMRESNQQMRDDVIIMDSLNRQLQHGILPIAPLPGLPRPGLGY